MKFEQTYSVKILTARDGDPSLCTNARRPSKVVGDDRLLQDVRECA